MNPASPEPTRRKHPLERTAEEHAAQNPTLHPSAGFQHKAPRPYITYLLLLVNIAVFTLGTVLGLEDEFFQVGANNHDLVLCQQYYVYRGGCVPADVGERLTRSQQRFVAPGGEFYRLFTAMFLHAGIAHIAFNMLALFSFGPLIERLYGRGLYLLLYLLGGLGGSALSAVLGSAEAGSVGASGALFALFGAEIVFFYRQRQIFGAAGNAQLRMLLFFAAANLLLGFTPGSSIDNWGHIGGLVSGVLLAWTINPTPQVRQVYVQAGEGVRPYNLITGIQRSRRTFVILLVFALGLTAFLALAYVLVNP